MRLRVVFSLFLSVSFAWLILSSGALTAEADSVPSGGHYLTVQETRDIIGSTIPFTYFNGSTYVDANASYGGYFTCSEEISENPCGFVSGSTFLYYSVPNNANNNMQHITFHMKPTYSIFDTEYLYTCFGLYGPIDISSTYQSPSSNWYIGGSNVHFENSNETFSDSGRLARIRFSGNYASYIPIVHRSQSTFSAYSVDADFCGNAGWTPMYFVVMCPYVSGDAFGQSGTFASSSGSGGSGTGSSGTDVNVNVNVDMTETNGLLGRIEVILSGIVDGIKGLFVPDDEFLSDWVDDMKQLLQDHLGGLYEAVTLSGTFMHQFETVQEKQSIYVPAASIPLSGSTFTIGPYTVPLKVDGLPSALYDGIAYIIDFIAIVLFLRMCRNKLEIFLNPDSEVVESDN